MAQWLMSQSSSEVSTTYYARSGFLPQLRSITNITNMFYRWSLFNRWETVVLVRPWTLGQRRLLCSRGCCKFRSWQLNHCNCLSLSFLVNKGEGVVRRMQVTDLSVLICTFPWCLLFIDSTAPIQRCCLLSAQREKERLWGLLMC